MELRTARLLLRRARPGDLEAMHAIMSSPVAMRHWSTPPHGSLDETRPWFNGQFFSDDPTRDEWIIEYAGRVLGFVGIWQMPEVGFMLHPDAWGRGMATEALAAFIRHAFATHPIDAITADVDPRNVASLRVLEKLGFGVTGTAESTFLLPDGWADSVYLSLPRPPAP